ncbi:MAG: glycosyltransferase [bacterium]
MKILVFLNYYLPGYKAGGPIRTIANLVDNLGEEFNFYIFTADRDAIDNKVYSNIRVDSWQKVGKAKVFYASPKSTTAIGVKKIIDNTDCDIVYLNSFFNFRFSILPLLLMKFGFTKRKKVVIAPRGEFSGGALALKSIKKKVFIYSAKLLGVYNGLKWHFSSEYEKEECIRIMGEKRISRYIIASNMSPKIKIEATDDENIKTEGSALKVICLSRISPKKNLDYAIKTLKKVRTSVQFDIYGMVNDENYWEECKKLISELPDNIKTKFKGPVENNKVISIISRYNLFFLPTRGENFGHVIAESVIAGTPVLISDQTPWKNLQEEGAGWDIPLESEGRFVEKIEEMCRIENNQYLEMRKKVKQYAKKKLENEEIIEANRKVFY